MTQEQAFSILKSGVNVFLTGEPGSGKTYTVNRYVKYLKNHGKNVAVTASTGIAATHIGGMTIHSWSGIGIKNQLSRRELRKIASSQYIKQRVRSAQVLIIEEVSMLTGNTLAMVDVVCREIKQSPEPFGGLQIVFSGDFFQLPPVVRRETGETIQTALIDNLSFFAYDSEAWAQANPVVCYLTEQHRQDDPDLLALLSALRRNAVGAKHVAHLKSRLIEHRDMPHNIPRLFSHNADVDRVNSAILAKLPGNTKSFMMVGNGPSAMIATLKKGCLSPEILQLKIGAAVMFTKNNPKEKFVNGTLGVIKSFDSKDGQPVVRTHDGRNIKVDIMRWGIEEDGFDVAQIAQIPLRLAWAITVHKSQGMSLDAAVMDLSDVFEFGQGYVALSRVRRLAGLHLLGWNNRALQVHNGILAQDIVFRTQSDQRKS